ncbi:MAG: hypothetical protein IKL60_03860 [Alistipes sp.]|nr:hypothetical protein [Alistipes sp.]
MKKLFLLVVVAISVASCGTLKNSATYRSFSVSTPYAVPVIADLDIASTRITYAYIPTKVVKNGGDGNVINTAIREALMTNGNADVLVGLETQIKYNSRKKIKSITLTGYPAKYKNFRNIETNTWYSNPYFQEPHQRPSVLNVK